MIEWLVSGLVSLLAWLWHSAMTLYYLAGFFVVLGGLVMFLGSIAHHAWKRAQEQRIAEVHVAHPQVTIQIENMTLQVTEAQLRRILTETDMKALPQGDPTDDWRAG